MLNRSIRFPVNFHTMDKNSKIQLILLAVAIIFMVVGMFLFWHLPCGSVGPIFPLVASIGCMFGILKIQDRKQ